MVTVNRPEAPPRFTTRFALVTAVSATSSIEISEVGVTEAFITACRESRPAPPSSRSPAVNVWRLPVVKPASKVSAPPVPEIVFEPVVSGLIQRIKSSKKIMNLADL